MEDAITGVGVTDGYPLDVAALFLLVVEASEG